jgi:hypothetical protein
MVFRIAQVNEVLVFPVHMCQALRVMELSFTITAVNQTYTSASYDVRARHGFFIYHYKSVVTCIRNYY